MNRAEFKKLPRAERDRFIREKIMQGIGATEPPQLVRDLPGWEPYASFATAKQKHRLWKEGMQDEELLDALSIDQASFIIGHLEVAGSVGRASSGGIIALLILGASLLGFIILALVSSYD